MRLGIARPKDDLFEPLEQQFQRALTPQERTWLILADRMLKHQPQPQQGRSNPTAKTSGSTLTKASTAD